MRPAGPRPPRIRGSGPLVTSTLVGLVIAYFAVAAALDSPDSTAILTLLGSKDNDLIARGQWWRLVTANLLHVGVVHLVVNTMALWSLGRLMELVLGPARYLTLFVITGVIGTSASYLFSPYPSAGASAALFGLVGCALVLGMRFKERLGRLVSGPYMWSLIAFNLALGFIVPRIDNAAHVGGLAAGMVVGLVVHPEPVLGPSGAWPRGLRLAAAAVTALLLGGGLAGTVSQLLPLHPREPGARIETRGMVIAFGWPWTPVDVQPGMVTLADSKTAQIQVFALDGDPKDPLPDPSLLLPRPGSPGPAILEPRHGTLDAPGVIGLWRSVVIHPASGPEYVVSAATFEKGSGLFGVRMEILRPMVYRYGQDLLVRVAGWVTPRSRGRR